MIRAAAISLRTSLICYNVKSMAVLQRFLGAAFHTIDIMTQLDLPGLARWGSVGKYLRPAVMRWAREWRGLTIDETAEKLSVKPSQVVAWENALEQPTLIQARMLAKACKRPFVEFFADEPPKLQGARHIEDFRSSRRSVVDVAHPDFRDLLIWVDGRRSDAIYLHEDLRGNPPKLPAVLSATLQDDPEQIASLARRAMGMADGYQAKIAAPKFLDHLRASFEDLGIITFKRGELTKLGAKGICFADSVFPAIVLSNEAPNAQALTLAHVLGHIALKHSGVIDPLAVVRNNETQSWCDRFAAAFLMPRHELDALFLKLDIDQNSIANGLPDEALSYMAKYFRVSEEAMLMRLVHLDLVAPSYYWEVKKPEFEAWQIVARHCVGRAKHASRYIQRMGRLYTGLVMEAWDADMITNHNAAEYMDIAKYSHLMEVHKIMACQE